MFWEEKFTMVNMENCGCHNVGKHRETKNGAQYISWDIYLKFGDLDNIKITSPEPKSYLVRPGKGLITSLVLKAIRTIFFINKAMFAITEFSLKYLSKIID